MADDVATASTAESSPPAKIRKSICKICGKRFSNQQLLGAHMRYTHPGGPKQGHGTHPSKKNRIKALAQASKGSFKCPECGRIFKFAMGLGKHRSAKHGIAGSSKTVKNLRKQQARAAAALHCPECGKGPFATPAALGSHRLIKHQIAGTSAMAAQRKLERMNRNGHSTSSLHNEAEIDGFTLGHTCASIQALIAHTAERDGVPAELLTSRVVDFLQASPLRKRGRPRSGM